MKILKSKIQFVIELLYIKKEIDLTHGAKLNFNWNIYIYIYIWFLHNLFKHKKLLGALEKQWHGTPSAHNYSGSHY